MSTKIIFCGDPHGYFSQIVQAAKAIRDASIVLLGDIQARRPLHEYFDEHGLRDRVWLIHGNHDTDSDADWHNLWGSELAERNIHGRIVTLPCGTRVAGLGGVFRGRVWDGQVSHFDNRHEHAKATPRQDRWQGGVARKHWSTIYPEEVKSLAVSGQADILVSHEAPSAHPYGNAAIDDLAHALGVKRIVHGHHHRAFPYPHDPRFEITSVPLRDVFTVYEK